MKVRYYLRLALVMLLATVTPAIATTLEQRLPVVRIDAENKQPNELGAALGQRIKQHFPDLEERYDRYLKNTLNQTQFDEWLNTRIKPLRSSVIDKSDRLEFQGLANALHLIGQNQLGDGHLSLDELWFLQFIPDIGGRSAGSAFGIYGGRSGARVTQVGRNVDQTNNRALRSLQAIIVYNYGKRKIVNIGFAGILGAVTGFNDRGLFLAHIGATPSSEQTYPSSAKPSAPTGAIGFDLRGVLNTQDQVAEAATILRNKRYSVSHSILIAGPTEVQVLEQPQGNSARIRSALTPTREEMAWERHQQIAVVGCFALPNSPTNCRHLHDRYRWQRFRMLAHFSPTAPRAQPSDVVAIMLDTDNRGYEIFNSTTMQAVVFTPQTRELLLYAKIAEPQQHKQPVMQRYANLTDGTHRSNESREILVLNLLSAVLVIAVVYIRWRQR